MVRLFVWMDGLLDGWMDGWMDGRMDGWMDVCMYVYIYTTTNDNPIHPFPHLNLPLSFPHQPPHTPAQALFPRLWSAACAGRQPPPLLRRGGALCHGLPDGMWCSFVMYTGLDLTRKKEGRKQERRAAFYIYIHKRTALTNLSPPSKTTTVHFARPARLSSPLFPTGGGH